MSDMTESEWMRRFAIDLMTEAAREVDMVGVHEAAEGSRHVPGHLHGELSDAEASAVLDLIENAVVTIEWPS